ncbi:MAG: hypothetical protein JWP01_310 [Myxococcales bacterium]|nr:hypothetical protein [Myxococcales bacterium]
MGLRREHVRRAVRTIPMRLLGLAVLSLTACGGSRAVTSTGAPAIENRETSVALPPLYAQLFVESEKEFPAEKIVSHQGEHGPETEKESGTITCTVSGVRAIQGGKVAELACGGSPSLPSSPSGTYVGTATGLWRIDGGDVGDDIARLDPKQMLVAAKPTKQRRETKDPDGDVDSGSAIIVEPHAGGWCVLVTSWGGDEGGWQLCLREAAGVIGGHGFFAGGETHDVYFGDVRRI